MASEVCGRQLDKIKLVDPKNLFGTEIWVLSPMKSRGLSVVIGETGSPLLLIQHSPLSNLVQKTNDRQRLTACFCTSRLVTELHRKIVMLYMA